MLLRIHVFWDVTLCCWVSSIVSQHLNLQKSSSPWSACCWIWRHQHPFNCQEALNQQHNITSQKTFIHKLQCYRFRRTVLSMKGQQGHHKDFTQLPNDRTGPEELTNGNISIFVVTKQFCTCTLHTTTITCVISGFHCSVNEVFAVLGWYAVLIGR